MSLDRTSPKRRNSDDVLRTNTFPSTVRKAKSFNTFKPKPAVIIEVPELQSSLESQDNGDSIDLGKINLEAANTRPASVISCNNNSANVSKATSVQSLSSSIYREQYCCSPNCRFSPREKVLSIVVAVLATIIIILVIIVGCMAGSGGIKQRFQWMF